MFRNFLFMAIVTAVLLSACGSAATETPANTPEAEKNNLPTLSGEWTITMTHSGGIMGLSRSIKISADGSYTVLDERATQTKQGQLSNAELANLVEVVNSSQYFPNKEPYGCADCFIYTIEIAMDSRDFSAQVDDITIEKSGLGSLVSALRNIIERELK